MSLLISSISNSAPCSPFVKMRSQSVCVNALSIRPESLKSCRAQHTRIGRVQLQAVIIPQSSSNDLLCSSP
jgi:hypothetical protein